MVTDGPVVVPKSGAVGTPFATSSVADTEAATVGSVGGAPSTESPVPVMAAEGTIVAFALPVGVPPPIVARSTATSATARSPITASRYTTRRSPDL